MQPSVAFVLLLFVRGFSASRNLVHDCDEVFNYWEPLHYLLYGYGFQTWEYSGQFALRSWLYILLHGLVASPAAWLHGAAAGKLAVFISTRAAMGLASAATETLLFSVVQRRWGPAAGRRLLWLLCLSSGMFTSATTFLPSTFAMYALTAGTAALLADQQAAVIIAAAVGILLGWVVAAVAFLPHALWVLLATPLLPAVRTAMCSALALSSLMLAADAWFYGRWTVSLWNFVRYNVVGGGQSALYGVEGPAYYLHNGALAFNLALPLALALPLLAALQHFCRRGPKQASRGTGSKPPAGTAPPDNTSVRSGRGTEGGAVLRDGPARERLRVAAALSPLWLWLAAVSALPHKEERFLYPVYPLICLAAALSLDAVEDIVAAVLAIVLRRRTADILAGMFHVGLMTSIVALSLARTGALLRNYSAPMSVFKALPEVQGLNGPIQYVCMSDEWHRFPSSFFLLGPRYRLQFVKSGFDGLLPRPFSADEGGTRAAPTQLNDQNREEPSTYWATSERCDYFVGASPPSESGWAAVKTEPFLDKDASPRLGRAFLLPWRPVVMLQYSLWRNTARDHPL